jgi:excisionase family DNA binding protein
MSLDADLADLVRRAVEPLLAEQRETRAELRALREAMPPQLLRPAEVAERYGIPVSSQRRLVRSGHLKATRVGPRTVLIDVSTLRAHSNDEIAAMASRARKGAR